MGMVIRKFNNTIEEKEKKFLVLWRDFQAAKEILPMLAGLQLFPDYSGELFYSEHNGHDYITRTLFVFNDLDEAMSRLDAYCYAAIELMKKRK